jgi:hypothetical protein
VSTANLTITGLSAATKTYDGSTTVSVTGTAAFSGTFNGDSVTPSGSVIWAFSNATVGTNKSLTRTGNFTSPNANYSVTQPTLTANITAAALTITANSTSKAFNNTISTPATAQTAFTSSGLVNSETIGSVTISYGSGAAAGDTAGTYSGSIVASAATGGSFSDSNYGITYVAGDIVVSASPTISTSLSCRPLASSAL